MELPELLKNCGLSEKEVAVYSTLIQHGNSLVSDIARHTGINRSTTYVILDALIKRGLIKSHEQRGIKIFAPLSLDTLAEYLDDESEKYAEQAKNARKMATRFKVSPPVAAAEPRIRFFNNPDEMADVFAGAVQSLELIRHTKAGLARPNTPLPAGITISDNKVFFVAADKKTGFVVESPGIASSLKAALQG